MRVVLSYIFFPMALAKYIEFALRRRDDVELFTVGPYTGTWIPWSGGINLPMKYAKPPDLPLSFNGHLPVVPASWVEQQLPWKPDLWLNVDAGWHLFGRPNHGLNVYVGTDPHALDYSQQRTLADMFFCMQTPYMKEGDKYLAYAYDPAIHYPEEQPRNYDACLIGLAYNERMLLVGELIKRGLKVYCGLGLVFDEYREMYNQAPFALAWSSQQDLCARVFEGAAMGRVVVTNRVPDLGKFFRVSDPSSLRNEDTDLIAFSSVGEAVEKVMYCHERPDELQEMAARGRAAVEPHTWDARLDEVLNVL